jgi:hypothetical protein
MLELAFDETIAQGKRGKKVRLVQEWLTLHGFGLVPDGKFGPATEACVREFQEDRGLPPTGTVGKSTFEALVEPMRSVLELVEPGTSLGETVVAQARRHLQAQPHEVGGPNAGPWVRLYMDGLEGIEFPWCAGFACFVLRQACEAIGADLPIEPSVSCDSIAASAKQRGLFVPESQAKKGRLHPGAFFLHRRTDNDWSHIGIVVEVHDDFFRTIEGNTNDEGSHEGVEVRARVRGYKSKDFVVYDNPLVRDVGPDRDAVIEHNAHELEQMNSEAASLLQQLFIECDQRGTLIVFENATPGGVLIDAHVMSGDPQVLHRIAKLLQITVDGDTLRVV